MDAKLVTPFIGAFTNVLPQLGFSNPEHRDLKENDAPIMSKGVSILVGFTKEYSGNVLYNMSEDTAKFIASTMMMGLPVEQLDEIAQSAVSELANMLTGDAAASLATIEKSVAISTASVSIGDDAEIHITNGKYWTFDMDVDGHVIEVNIAID